MLFENRFMNIVSKRPLGILFALLLTVQFCAAQPSGPVAFSFDRSNFPVWDLTGAYQLTQPIVGAGGAPVDLSFGVSVSQSSQGQLHGSGTTLVSIGDDTFVAGTYTVQGAVVSRHGSTRVVFSIRLKGFDWIAGSPRHFSIQTQYALTLNPETLTLDGTVRGTLAISGIGGSVIHSDISIPLPPGVDGSWTVTLNFLPLKRLTGTATFSISGYASPNAPAGFPTSRILQARLTGVYSSRTGLAKVALSGVAESRGTSLVIEFEPGAAQPEKMTGRVLGQSVKE